MPKICVRPVDRVGMNGSIEQVLYSGLIDTQPAPVYKPQNRPHYTQFCTPALSTAIWAKLPQLIRYLSTIYTRLITNTTNTFK